MTGETKKCLQVFVEDCDEYGDEPLYEAIVRFFQKQGVAGATVFSGIMGYGASRRIHKKGLFGVSDERPVVIIAIDEEAKLRSILPGLLPMIKEGLVVLLDAEVFIRAPGL